MKKDSGKRGLVLRFDIRKKMLSQLTWEEWGHLIDLALIYADPQDPSFEKPPDLEKEFPGMDGDRARLYRQSWELLAADAREDDERLVYKNSRRNYSAFCTNAKRWGHLSEEEIIPYKEWQQLGEPGWRQWDRLGRPLPPVDPLTISPAASLTADRYGSDDTVTEPFDTVADRYGPNANNNSKSISTDNNSSIPNDNSKSDTVTPTVGASLSLPLVTALKRWKEYSAEKGRPVTGAAEKALAAQMGQYAERYGAEQVASLVQECIGNGWRNIQWERLERNPDRYGPHKGGGQDPMENLRTVYEMFGDGGS